MLRLCLCLGLLVNGSAQALAATHAAVSHHQSRAGALPCHESGGVEATEAAPGHATAAGTGMLDCCKSGVCDGVCSHSAFAVLPVVEAGGKGIDPTTRLNVMSARYASPSLPRLIRPPIL